MALRAALQQFRASDPKNLLSHPGLWIDKMLAAEEAKSEVAGPHLKRVAGPKIPDGYEEAFRLRRSGFDVLAEDSQSLVYTAQVGGRMVIGLGAKGVLEMGLSLDHTWGVPYLPGSALKGVAAAAAHRAGGDGWTKFAGWPDAAPPADAGAFTDYQILFGTTGNAGTVVFHDAWWDPTGEREVPIHMDVMTVHHPKYYQAAEDKAELPTDFDEPTPVPFLSGGGRFLVAIEGPDAWVQAAAHWLTIGLRDLGIGAKTSSGYGRASLTLRESEGRKNRRLAAAGLTKELANFKVNQKDAAVNAILRALAAGVGESEFSKALALVDRKLVGALIDASGARLGDADRSVLESARPVVPAPVAPAASAGKGPRPEPGPQAGLVRTRAWYEPDKKSDKRYAIRLESEGKAFKNHLLVVDCALLDEIKESGKVGLEVLVEREGAALALRRA